jgi:hypothetical protein
MGRNRAPKSNSLAPHRDGVIDRWLSDLLGIRSDGPAHATYLHLRKLVWTKATLQNSLSTAATL